MRAMKIKITKSNIITLAAMCTALVGMLVYVITSVTGYLAASGMNPWPIICTVVCVALLCTAAFLHERFTPLSIDFMIAAGFVMLLVSLYFIPVNYPEAEATALHVSIVGVVFYLIALLALVVEGFRKKA